MKESSLDFRVVREGHRRGGTAGVVFREDERSDERVQGDRDAKFERVDPPGDAGAADDRNDEDDRHGREADQV